MARGHEKSANGAERMGQFVELRAIHLELVEKTSVFRAIRAMVTAGFRGAG